MDYYETWTERTRQNWMIPTFWFNFLCTISHRKRQRENEQCTIAAETMVTVFLDGNNFMDYSSAANSVEKAATEQKYQVLYQ